ncbi:hypothetical protein SEUCBS140593_006153 [Sporothrix eucalyptigena]|uniref:Zn(2)-C6 fungal-type domain-containing protein n=1 Tax=Sporothrix eucalyptigena TaxID=1812306 RepID=A0ABP0C2R5_9PEZI
MSSVPPPSTTPNPASQGDMPKRRRASRACLACRARKVRCDVVLCGKPCTNCRLDFSECVVQLRRKNRCRTIVVPSNNRLLSVKEVAESDEDNISETAALPSASAPEPTKWPPASAAEKNSPPPADNVMPAFEWDDVLAPGLANMNTIAPAQSLASLSEATTNDTVSFVPSVSSDTSISHHSASDNGLPDNDANATTLEENLADFGMLIDGSMEEDERAEQATPVDDTHNIEAEVVMQTQPESEPMSYELLSHTVDNFSLYDMAASSVTAVGSGTAIELASGMCHANSEAWQRMHFPFSPSLFTTANANVLTMPFAAAVDSITSWSSSGNGLSSGTDLPSYRSSMPRHPVSTSARQRRATEPTPEPAHMTSSMQPPPQPQPKMTKPANPPPPLNTAAFSTPSAAPSSDSSAFVIFSRYPFLSSKTLWKLDHEDDALVLEQRGCLHVPKKSILDEMMKQYFLHVHPMVPLLNELDFWTMYNSPTPLSAPFCQMSLFVFQAMLFIVCPFVSQETLAQLNFSSVPEARANFYRRAKTLFHLEEGRDDISTAQAALMLTYQSSSMKDRTSNFWLSTSIHFARSAHAHRYFDLKSTHTQRRTVLKRLWWCCILRDKVVSLGMRRPMHIGPADFDTQRPGLNEQDTSDEIPSSTFFSPSAKRVLSQVFARLCELAGILTDVLDICYPASGKSLRVADASVAQDYVTKLDAWYETATTQFKASMELAGNDESLLVFTNAAYIYYYIARASIYNYISHIIATHPEAVVDEVSYGSPPAKVDESFRGVTKSLAELKQRDLVRYLPNTFVSMAILPFKWHVAGVRVMGGKASGKETDLTVYYAVFKGFGEFSYESTGGTGNTQQSQSAIGGNVVNGRSRGPNDVHGDSDDMELELPR